MHARTSSSASSHITVSTSSTSSKSSLWSFRSASPLFDRALDFAAEQSETPLVRWLRKHSNDPVSAGKRWIVERLQFSSAMFDPSGLKERYIRLVNWRDGMWVNYWTQTLPKSSESGRSDPDEEGNKDEQIAYNDLGLMESGIVAPPTSLESPSSSIEREWMRETGQLEKHGHKPRKNEPKAKGARNFIVLPTGLGGILGGEESWEKVVIGGVDDEVAAHCGLFIRGQNLDYDGLLERVARRILQWCAQM